jgi:hypothetical protein
MDDFIAKPVGIATLRAAIERVGKADATGEQIAAAR